MLEPSREFERCVATRRGWAERIKIDAKEQASATRIRQLAMPTSTPGMAALGRAVLAIRTEKGVSQAQLAEAAGFRHSWASNVEHGRRNPSWANVVRLVEGLGVPLGESW